MASRLLQGESLFIPFRDGVSISDSQLKLQMYKTQEAFKKSFPEYDLCADGMELIEYAPVAHGRWEHTHTSSSYYSECWKCSVCGFEDTEGYDFRFCPTCGAKMNLED